MFSLLKLPPPLPTGRQAHPPPQRGARWESHIRAGGDALNALIRGVVIYRREMVDHLNILRGHFICFHHI